MIIQCASTKSMPTWYQLVSWTPGISYSIHSARLCVSPNYQDMLGPKIFHCPSPLLITLSPAPLDVDWSALSLNAMSSWRSFSHPLPSSIIFLTFTMNWHCSVHFFFPFTLLVICLSPLAVSVLRVVTLFFFGTFSSGWHIALTQ